MRCDNGGLGYDPAVCVGHDFRRFMRTGSSSRLDEQPVPLIPERLKSIHTSRLVVTNPANSLEPVSG